MPTQSLSKAAQLVGCEFSDLQALVRRNGLDSALQQLASEGVYLTSAEFKGKKEVRRSGVTFGFPRQILKGKSIGRFRHTK